MGGQSVGNEANKNGGMGRIDCIEEGIVLGWLCLSIVHNFLDH